MERARRADRAEASQRDQGKVARKNGPPRKANLSSRACLPGLTIAPIAKAAGPSCPVVPDPRFRSLLQAPSATVLTTYRRDGSAHGRAFAQQRKPGGTVLRFSLTEARMWDLSATLPSA